MEEINTNIGWNFDNTYISLPKSLMTKVKPVKVNSPKLKIFNKDLASYLNLNFNSINDDNLALIFSGNKLLEGTETIAQAYAGHQFGYFTMLGDGRAVLLGEHSNKNNEKFDIQLKGSGKTPYSRNGDGRAALGPMLREHLMSEAMHGLNVPTTRSLAVVTTGEEVMRDTILQGAILTRVASSHIRIGTFQYAAMQNTKDILKKLLNYTLKRHYYESIEKDNIAVNLLKVFMEKQISLVVNWMRIGFIHGVLNTDNISLAGETIDYGPCGFMDYYDPKTVFSSIDQHGRYSFVNQQIICHWNLSRFAETLIPFFSEDEKKSIEIGTNIINFFNEKFKSKWLKMMKKKLGFINDLPGDEKIINKLLKWMENNKADYTNTFLYLMGYKIDDNNIYNNIDFKDFFTEWENRIGKNNISKKEINYIMKCNNPFFIPRNHIVENALYEATTKNTMGEFNFLLKLLQNPYKNNKNLKKYQKPSDLEFNNTYKTFCGT